LKQYLNGIKNNKRNYYEMYLNKNADIAQRKQTGDRPTKRATIKGIYSILFNKIIYIEYVERVKVYIFIP
jgi:hypothetical protein